MSEVTLSKAVRSNLLNLQNTATQLSKTQERLATGLKVNSALDNPTNFFTASSLNARADDLGGLLDNVSNAIQTVNAADNGIKAITKLVQTAQSTARQALTDKSTSSTTTATGSTAVAGATDKATAAATELVDDLAFTDAKPITFTSTNATTGISQTFTYTVADGDTVGDLVDAVNASGVASASIGSDGKVSFATDGGSSLTIAATVVATESTDPNYADTALTALGFAATPGVDAGADGGDDTASFVQAAAGSGGASASRAALADQFNDILTQIDQLAGDSGFNGVNLLGSSSDSLKVAFNEKGDSSITIQGVDFSSDGLGLASVTNGFATDDNINDALDALGGALSTLRSQSSTFGSNLSVIETRQDFTKNMISTLQTGAANLTLADTNEEAANLLALQTRQQLSSTALSLASQADQQVLRLF